MRPLMLDRLLEEVEKHGPDRVAGQTADALADVRRRYKAGDSKAKRTVELIKARRKAKEGFKEFGSTEGRPGIRAVFPRNVPTSARQATRALQKESSQPADVKTLRRSRATTLAAQRRKGINPRQPLPGKGLEARGPNHSAGTRAALASAYRKDIQRGGPTAEYSRNFARKAKDWGMKDALGMYDRDEEARMK